MNIKDAKKQIDVCIELLNNLPDFVKEKTPSTELNIRSLQTRLKTVQEFLQQL